MAAALQINFALWGMLICASMKLVPVIQTLFIEGSPSVMTQSPGAHIVCEHREPAVWPRTSQARCL